MMDRRSAMLALAAVPAAAQLKFPKLTIFEARKIVTMSQSMPSARYMAVADGMVVALADSREALVPWSAGRQVELDRRFADKVIFPGLIDPHIHPMQSAVMLGLPFLAPDDWSLPSGHWPGVTGEAAYRSRLNEIAEQSDAEPLIVWGHHELFHGPMDRSILDSIAPNTPLFVWQRSFHDIFANTAALDWMGLSQKEAFEAAMTAGHVEPGHGNFERGIFSETGLQVALAKLQSVLLAPGTLSKGFAGLLQMMNARGVTTTSDLATGIFARFDQEATLITGAFNSAGVRARVNLMAMAAELDQIDDVEGWLADRSERFVSSNVMLKRRIKLFADGAFFAQNMRMGPPGYSDGHLGKWITQPSDLRGQMRRYWDNGFALHIHVNGDEGAAEVLDGLRSLRPRIGQDIVLEHLGYCTEAQIRKIAEMGLKVSAQPNYIRVLGQAYGQKGFGPDRASLMNRLGSLERASVPLGLHSDFNMAPIDPFYLAWIAQTREGIDGVVRGPAERISREKALRAITIEAAQVIGMDDMVGSLAAGKKADFIVLDENPFEIEIDAMKEMPVLATVFEGRN
jgi:predicted amidohydrolase YtcJ